MSKTDHPRYYGTHQVGHAPRSWREMGKGDRIEYGTPKRVVTALMAVTEIHEVVEAVKPDLCKFCRAPLVPLAEWERILLETDDEFEDVTAGYCGFACMDDHLRFADDGLAWSTDDETLEAQGLRREFVNLQDVGEEAFGHGWLPLVTIEECRDIFGGGDFIIDHTNVSRAKPVRWS